MSLEKAKRHYADLIKGSKIKIDITEWDITIYMRPIQHLSVSTASKLKKFTAMDNAIGAAETIVALATTADEDKEDKFSFSKADLHDLIYNVNAEIVMQIYLEWVTKSNELAVEEKAAIKK